MFARHFQGMIWLVASLLVVTVSAHAGSSTDAGDDDSLKYFGFVKDTNGQAIPGARVTATLKGALSLSASTDAAGAYNIPVPRLLDGVSPENIVISCGKDGFAQAQAFVRSDLNQKPLIAVEVECTLQSNAAK